MLKERKFNENSGLNPTGSVFASEQTEKVSTNYFGWWYFDFVTPEGIAINVVIHETDVFGLSDKKYMSASVALPNVSDSGRRVAYYKKDLQVNHLTDESGRLNVEGLVVEKDGNVKLNLDFGNFAISGVIESRTMSPQTQSRLDTETKMDKSNNWKVIVSDGKFDGYITSSDGKTLLIEAQAYMDRNWGTEKFQTFVKDWVWGHFSNGESTIIFYDVMTNEGERRSKIFIINNGNTTENKLTTSYLNDLSIESSLEKVEIVGSLADSNTVAQIEINSQNLMRAWFDKDLGGFRASYLRWHSTLKTTFKGVTTNMNGITEYMRIRKEKENQTDPEFIILLTGLSGSGKSTLSKMVADAKGFTSLDSRDIYKPLAKRNGYDSAREYLSAVGNKIFMDGVIDECVRAIKNGKNSNGFVLDAAGSVMLSRMSHEFPDSNIKIISIEADDQTRTDRIEKRQGLTKDEAAKEKTFRDSFLLETGVQSTIERAGLVVFNGNGSDLEKNIKQIVDYINSEN